MSQCGCDHTCEFHQFKIRISGTGDTTLLITRDSSTMIETHYRMSAEEAERWCEQLRNVDQVKFEDLLLSRMSLQQAYEALS